MFADFLFTTANCNQPMVWQPAFEVPEYLTNGFQEPFQVRVGSSTPLLYFVFPWWKQIWPLSYVFSIRL